LRGLEHPNGAVDLVEAGVCVAEAELAAVQARYESYLDQPARTDGPARVFDLDGAALTLVADADLGTLLPGEHAPALPVIVACAVMVHDLAVTRKLLLDNGFPVGK
jgi:hypothetical protein